MWDVGKKIRNEEYSWLKIDSNKKKKLNRLIDIYSKFNDIVDIVEILNTKVERIKLLKNAPDDDED